MPRGSNNEYARVWEKLHATMTSEQWRGYDPYDGLNSPLASAIPWKPWRQTWIQFHKRSPFNFRPLFGIPKQVNPKTLALGVSALCCRYMATGDYALLKESLALAEQMIDLRSKQSSNLAWGYPFDWQSRAFFAPAGTPNMICTVFAATALLDLHDASNQPRYLLRAVEAVEFILTELPRTEKGDTFCFSYTTLDRSCVHNVNLLGAALVARVGRLMQKPDWLAQAKAAIQFSVNAQAADGSWKYGTAENQSWIDSFHTGYNLVALKQYHDGTADKSFQAALQRGWEYYHTRFFLEDGTPQYYHDAMYPIDVHNCAQGIITFLEIGRDRACAERIAQWALQNLWDERGYFWFQKTRSWTNRIAYVRWAEAWMLLSLSKLLQVAR